MTFKTKSMGNIWGKHCDLSIQCKKIDVQRNAKIIPANHTFTMHLGIFQKLSKRLGDSSRRHALKRYLGVINPHGGDMCCAALY